MAITVNILMEEMRETYQLKYITGEENGENVVTWVHLTEDASVAELFVGNELVVTSGYTARDEESLLRFIGEINQKPLAGLVINIGKYILEIPQSAIDLCNWYKIPLLTMPWGMSATDFAKSCCVRIERRQLEIEQVNQAAMVAIQSPYNPSGYRPKLSEFFDESAGFQILVISSKAPIEDRRDALIRSMLRIHTAVYNWSFQFLVFQMDKLFVLIVNQNDRDMTDEIANHILEIYIKHDWEQGSIHIGIGEPINSFSEFAKSYHSAIAAIRRGMMQNHTIYRFSDMGFYKLLYSIPDEGLMEEYYEQRLAPLLEYDKAHDGSYVETLFRYLLHDGSLAEVAEEMYTHRNTINYRMGKIRDLLGLQLDSQYDRFPLIMAFHIGVVLDKIPNYELDMLRMREEKK
ncbi:MAG: PucR family transcriptional regulator ligand-binding domain-containing protein [Lachnospiraceae bacterium]|nr:PucR family transcriptional regulator ligand-binding domain-containing protein [Lachnospiraceae bacterium]